MTALRLFLHVLAASVWVGGQITLAGLVPTVRKFGPEATKAAAQAFNRLAWPAFALVVVTGLWNLMATPMADFRHPWIELKILAVVISGFGAAAHQNAKGNKAVLAIGGAAGALGGVAAMYLGFLVTTTP